MVFIRTENLLLRPGWIDDAPALTEAFAREDVVMTLAKAPWPYRLDDAVDYLGRDRSAHEADLLVFLRTFSDYGTPRLIGGIGIADRDGESELGYWIVPSHWGRGYATEAGRAVVAAARDSLRIDRLVSGHFTDNPASGRVLRKLGFSPTGVVEPRASRARAAIVPCQTYAMALSPSLALAA
jgi:RimJ/RimL family protein N-acetyltransferase